MAIVQSDPVKRGTRAALLTFHTEKFPPLTGIRAIAAYLVFLHHYTPSAGLISAPLSHFLAEGHIGVTLFYVLSGFLIAYNYWDKAKGLSSGFWLQYLTRRIARIYPLYLFLLAATFVIPAMAWHAAWPSLPTLFLNITLTKGWFNMFAFSWIGQAWSLTVEETFYLTAPLLFLVIRKYGYPAVPALLYTVGGLLLLIGSKSQFYGFFGSFRFVALYTFFGRCLEFVAGIALARALLQSPRLLSDHKGKWRTPIGVLGCAFVAYLMSLLRTPQLVGLVHPAGMVLNNIVLPIFICFLFYGLIAERSMLARILGSPVFVFLGRASYAFYLAHVGIFVTLFQSRFKISNEPLRLLALFAFVNVLAAILFVLVEHPANHFIRGLARRLEASFSHPAMDPPRQHYRAYAIGATVILGAVFFAWRAVSSDWLRPAVKDMQAPPRQLAVGPALGRMVSAQTDFRTVTSDAQQIGFLQRQVGGEKVDPTNFIFAHANSRIVFDTSSRNARTFEFSIGLDDVGSADHGSVQYVVRGDGRVLFQSPIVRPLDPQRRYTVNVAGVKLLELIVNDAGDGIQSDEAYWINPTLR